METMTSAQLAQLLYVAYYGRPADSAGQSFWADQIDAVGTAGVAADFGASAEFTERFGELSNEELVNNLYQQLFGRDGEQAGVDYWVNLLENGTTLADIALEIANGAQNDDITAINNKVAVAQRFTDLAGEEYTGNDAANSARDFLMTVNAETDVEAVDVQAAIDALTPTTVFTLAEALEAEELPEGYEIDAEAVFAADVTVEAAVAAFTAAQGIIEGAANAEDLVFEDLFTWNIVDDADAIIAEAGNIAVTGAGTVTVTNESISQAQFDALSQLENFELGEVTVDGLTLTEQLEALANAREEMQLTEDEIIELLVESGIIANAAAFDIEELENYKLDAQEVVDQLNADLSAARAETFTAYGAGFTDGDLTTKDGADIEVGDVTGLFTSLEVSGRMTDANLADLVTSAKAAVRADEAVYDVNGTVIVNADGDLQAGFIAVYSDGTNFTTNADDNFVGYVETTDVPTGGVVDFTTTTFNEANVSTFSASALESRVIAADAALANHVTTQGEQSELLANIAEVAAAYVAQNTSSTASAYVAAYATALEAVDGDASQVTLASVQTELNALIDASFDGSLAGGDLDVSEVSLADNARGDALANALTVQATRYELEEAADDAEDAFMAVDAGANQRIAEALQAERADLIQDRDDAVEVSSDLNDAIEAYNAAKSEFDQIAEDLGFEVQDLDAAFEFATDEADLFTFALSDFTNDDGDVTLNAVTVNDLEAGDALFFGGYVLGDGTGDNNVLEFFIEQTGTNTVVTVESSAFGGAAGEGNIEVTLTGISADQLNVEGGLISIVEVA